MHKRTSLAACGTLLAIGASLFTATIPASASTGSRGRARLRQRQHGRCQHDRGVRPARRRVADTRSRDRRSPSAAPASAPASVRRARSRPARTTASCSRSTPAATRSRSCASTASGVPQPVGAPVSSGGVEPVSIAINRFGLVYVANVGNGGSNYAGFLPHPARPADPAAAHTVAGARGLRVSVTCFFNSTGDRLVGTRDNTSLIDSFTVRLDGRLVPPHPARRSPAQSLGPIGSRVPADQPLAALRLATPTRAPASGTVSAFRVSRRGVLTSIGDSPVPDGQTAPCWVEISHDGKWLFAVNTGSATISPYAHRRDGSLVLHRHDAVHQRRRCRRRPAVARRQDPVGHRRPRPGRQHLRRQRWRPDRAGQLADAAAGRNLADGPRRPLTAVPRPCGAGVRPYVMAAAGPWGRSPFVVAGCQVEPDALRSLRCLSLPLVRQQDPGSPAGDRTTAPAQR